MFKHTILLAAVAGLVLALAAGSANAGIVSINAITGFHGGQYTGLLPDLITGTGMTKPDPLDPSTWTATPAGYSDEWEATSLLNSATSANSKIGWVAFDLGSSTAGLQKLYFWNLRDGGGDRGTKNYNIYYSNTPTVALPAMPGDRALANTGLTPTGDYDFASGGWTLFNTSGSLSLTKATSVATGLGGIVDLGGISARYIGVEILTNWGTTRANVGLSEVALTPEPATMALLGLGGLGLVLGRKRK